MTMIKQKQDSYDWTKQKYEETSGEIMVIENDSYTIREILEKFTTGVLKPNELSRSGFVENDYNPEIMADQVPEFIDVTDVQAYVDKTKSAWKNATEKAKKPISNDVRNSDAGEKA